MSQNGGKIHSETEMNINFIFFLLFLNPHPSVESPSCLISGYIDLLRVGFFVCMPSKSFRSMTVDVVGCYCNIKWKIPQQLFPAARSWLRHFPFLNVFNGIPSHSMAVQCLRVDVYAGKMRRCVFGVWMGEVQPPFGCWITRSLCRIDYCELIDWRLFSVWIENGI